MTRSVSASAFATKFGLMSILIGLAAPLPGNYDVVVNVVSLKLRMEAAPGTSSAPSVAPLQATSEDEAQIETLVSSGYSDRDQNLRALLACGTSATSERLTRAREMIDSGVILPTPTSPAPDGASENPSASA